MKTRDNEEERRQENGEAQIFFSRLPLLDIY